MSSQIIEHHHHLEETVICTYVGLYLMHIVKTLYSPNDGTAVHHGRSS